VPPYARLLHGKDLTANYVLVKPETIVGRSETCDIQLNDPFVSRRQAKISKKGDEVTIENIGRNAILVNAEPTERAVLEDGDMVHMGNTLFVFRRESPLDLFGDPAPEDLESETEMTVVLQGPQPSKDPGPRLVVLEPDGLSRVHPIRGDLMNLGRSTDCDVHLMDASISRTHARIEKRGESFHVVKLSKINPLLINQKDVTEKRLLSGDELQIGPFRLSFVSDRQEDLRPAEPTILGSGKMSGLFAWLALAVGLLAVMSYLGYSKAYLPWKLDRQIDTLAHSWASGDAGDYQRTVEDILSRPLSKGARTKALELLAGITIAQSDRLVPEGKFAEARTLLSEFLSKYGAEKASESVEARLDQLRLQFGQRLQIGGDSMGALREFSSITEESPHFDEAQRALSHIWRAYQKENVTEMPLAQLMAEADGHFAARRFTTPIGKNAYAIYQTILSLDPNNQTARDRIEQMKVFYKEKGQSLSQQKNCAGALIYLERYLLISPEDSEVREMAKSCKKSRTGAEARRRRTQQGAQPGSTDERIDRILEDTEMPANPDSP
jgi:pSer/pThr/pTyr-binding forkhead associated (FHA) protein